MNPLNPSHALVLTTRVWELLPFWIGFSHEMRRIPEIFVNRLVATMTTA